MGIERRRFLRVHPSPSRPIELQLMGDGWLEVVRAVDISATGIGFHVAHGFLDTDIKGDVKLVVKLPGERPFVATGAIRHVRHATSGRYFGVEFTEISAAASEAVRAYVDERSKRSNGS